MEISLEYLEINRIIKMLRTCFLCTNARVVLTSSKQKNISRKKYFENQKHFNGFASVLYFESEAHLISCSRIHKNI